MQSSALHPFDPAVAGPFVQAMIAEGNPPVIPGIDPAWSDYTVGTARDAFLRATQNQDAGFHDITAAFGQVAASLHPTFQQDGLSLTVWEAQIDRGISMYMRPPARFFIDAGLEPTIARRLAIRLDFSLGMMGGAYVPPHLVPRLATLLDDRFDRLVKRLVAAEIDPYPHMTVLMEAVTYANDRGLGLFETLGVVIPDVPMTIPPSGEVVQYDRKRSDPGLRKRIELAAKPVKEQGKLGKLLGRGKMSPLDDFPSQNGYIHVDE